MCGLKSISAEDAAVANIISEKLEIGTVAAPFGSANVECQAILTGKKCLTRCESCGVFSQASTQVASSQAAPSSVGGISSKASDGKFLSGALSAAGSSSQYS